MQRADVYIETDSLGTRVMQRGYGYVLACEVKGELRTREGFGRAEGTYNQITLTAMIEALERFRRPCELHLHTKNTYILNMVENNLEKWAVCGFMKSGGAQVKYRQEWESVWRLTKEHLLIPEPGEHPYSGWLKREMERRKGNDTIHGSDSG